MAPIPIYSSSPINAVKAPGASSQGPSSAGATNTLTFQQPDIPTTTSTTKDRPTKTSYPAPQPGASPPGPSPTTDMTARSSAPTPYAPSGPGAVTGPPPPQPGATPTVPGRTPGIHSPSGVRSSNPQPPQMAMPPPTTTHAHRSSTANSFPGPPQAGQRPVSLPTGSIQSIPQPPAYQQARPAPSPQEWSDGTVYGDDDEGVWGAAKKWAQNAGDSLAAAESEVWRRISKD